MRVMPDSHTLAARVSTAWTNRPLGLHVCVGECTAGDRTTQTAAAAAAYQLHQPLNSLICADVPLRNYSLTLHQPLLT